MSRVTLFAGLAIILTGTACSNSDQPAALESGDESTVFDPMTSTIDRARGVEQQVDQRVDELNKRLEEAEGR